jgi:pimeloyl-ACP methyl ester carboxylesterase
MSRPIVALHGVGTAPALWHHVAARLAPRAFDAVDVGALALECGDFSAITQVLERRCPPGAVVLANSFSTALALALAPFRPDLAGIVVSGVGPLTPDVARRTYLRELIPAVEAMGPEVAASFVDALMPLQAAAAAGGDNHAARAELLALLLAPGRAPANVALLRLSLPDLAEPLVANRVPLRVVHGRADATVDPAWPASWVEGAAAADARLVALDAVGHYPELECPGTIAELALELMAAADVRGATPTAASPAPTVHSA